MGGVRTSRMGIAGELKSSRIATSSRIISGRVRLCITQRQPLALRATSGLMHPNKQFARIWAAAWCRCGWHKRPTIARRAISPFKQALELGAELSGGIEA
jgi:hypothetical protein